MLITDVSRVIRLHYKEEEIKITQDYHCFETEVAKIFFGSQPWPLLSVI